MTLVVDYDAFFKAATGTLPFPYQSKLASGPTYEMMPIPTGSGKTAAVVLSWIWRRRFGPTENRPPRRLVYCLPMRTLVEQTVNNVHRWLDKLGSVNLLNGGEIPVHVLMGGEDAGDWVDYPEREAILVGTQDMLLSRALNRGYGSSRFRWPRDFGLLNNDCLWVLDEVQLMGPGLATSVQLHAFRRLLGTYGECRSIWMSATLDPSWLATVDHPQDGETLRLSEEDRRQDKLNERLTAKKALRRSKASYLGGSPKGYALQLAREVADRHSADTLSLVILNTVPRAREVYRALLKLYRKGGPDIRLIHSRFRPNERRGWFDEFLSDSPKKMPPTGRIIVSTQVVEAGVDMSARALTTELAPWSNLVQRFGRCNRSGDCSDASIVWCDLADKVSAPYRSQEMRAAREKLDALEGKSASPEALEKIKVAAAYDPEYLLRRRDLLGLFDTTPDLSGMHADISRFIRQEDSADALAFWRTVDGEPKNEDEPERDELCPVPAGELTGFLVKHRGWRMDPLEEKWVSVSRRGASPGDEIMLDSSEGGYSEETGWDPESSEAVRPVPVGGRKGMKRNGFGSDAGSEYWQTLEGHAARTNELAAALLVSLADLGLPADVLLASRLHDLGKAHPVFQRAIVGRMTEEERQRLPAGVLWAKSKHRGGRYERSRFRHELASAVTVRNMPWEGPADRDLVSYLVAAHHGKVRLSLRSLPDETAPSGGARFALGVWDGDEMPGVALGEGYKVPGSKIDLSTMEVGADANGRPSWLDSALGLRDALGPFKLAYLESLVRAADVRASEDPGLEGVFR